MIVPHVQPAEEIPPWPPTGHIPDPVCRACGWERTNTKEPDGCLGWLPDVRQVCCGHGRLYLKDGKITETTELWLDFDIRDSDSREMPLIIGPGPVLHDALDAWRSGDLETYSRIVAEVIANHVGHRIYQRLKSIVEVERAAGIPQRSASTSHRDADSKCCTVP